MDPCDAGGEQPAVVTKAAEVAVVFSEHYIVRADLLKYGLTASCFACDEAFLGAKRRGGVPHSDQCRERIDKALRDDHKR